MTGFGAAEVLEDGLSVRVEIRSVNHRFLQLRHRIPPELGELEPQLETLLKKRLARGAVTTSLNVTRATTSQNVAFDAELAKRYRTLLGKAAKGLEIEDDLSLSRLVLLPGVIGTKADEKGREREQRASMRASEAAIAHLLETRAIEGKTLERDLRKNAAAIAKLVARIEKRMPQLVKAHQEALARRVSDLLGDPGKLAPADLAREIALIADRHDVSEEITRLKSHLEQLDALLEKGGACGRQLDFLVQELLREANTIGSKCNDAPVAHAVVELKTHIERVREQVQNVE